jgi:pimeloyl-ACP methyl ester carboxylesterase
VRRTVRKVLKVTAWFLGIALVIGLVYFVPDSLSRLSMSDEPTSTVTVNENTPDKGVVFTNGAGVPDMVIEDLRPVFAQQGNFVEIRYSPELFDREKVINLIIEKIRPYKHVTFAGASMGGMVAYDVIHVLRQRGDTRNFGLILIDSPTGKWSEIELPPSEVIEWPTKALSCLPFGRISNQFFSSGRPQGDLTTIHPRDPSRIKLLWDGFEAYPWSGRSDQGCYVFYHEALQPLSGVSAVYIRSTKDMFVKDSALEGWRQIVSLPEGRVLYVPAAHMSFLDEPVLYERAFQRAFELTG